MLIDNPSPATSTTALPDGVASASTEKRLRAELARTAEELRTTSEELERTTAELRTLGADLDRLSAEVEPFAEALARGSSEHQRTQMVLEAAVAAGGGGIAVVDAELRVTHWADAMQELWGVAAVKAVNQPLEALPIDEMEAVMATVTRCLETGEVDAAVVGDHRLEVGAMLDGAGSVAGAVILVAPHPA